MELQSGICATCKHFIVTDSGREFEQIIDTEFMEFHCNIFDQKTKEFFLMSNFNDNLEKEEKNMCEFWEDWNSY